jgi:glycosyltransferase involved in cell wall biosynthesis
VLLDALAELTRRGRRLQLAIVGQGPHEAALRAQVERLGLQDRVAFTGFLSNPAGYYHQADLFVIPSLTEGLPNVLIEALICGLPSIAADCPTGPREILEDGKWGTLVPPGDVAALANALAAALDRLPEERLRAQAASRALREKYDIELGLPALEQRFLDVALTSPARRVPA